MILIYGYYLMNNIVLFIDIDNNILEYWGWFPNHIFTLFFAFPRIPK